MNHITNRNRIEKQMLLYIDFLPLCENNLQKMKLLDEINRIRFQIERVDKMGVFEASEELIITYKTLSSDD